MSKKSAPFKHLPMLAERIKGLRQAHKISQSKMGSQMGVTEGAVRSWESGRAEPPLAYLVFLAEQFNCDLNWLLLGKQPGFRQSAKSLDLSDPDVDKIKKPVPSVSSYQSAVERPFIASKNEDHNSLADVIAAQKTAIKTQDKYIEKLEAENTYLKKILGAAELSAGTEIVMDAGIPAVPGITKT